MRYSTHRETRFIKFVSKVHKKYLQSVITKIGIFIHGIFNQFSNNVQVCSGTDVIEVNLISQ